MKKSSLIQKKSNPHTYTTASIFRHVSHFHLSRRKNCRFNSMWKLNLKAARGTTPIIPASANINITKWIIYSETRADSSFVCARGRIARINSIKRDLTVIIIIRALSVRVQGATPTQQVLTVRFLVELGFHGLRITFSFAFCSSVCVCMCVWVLCAISSAGAKLPTWRLSFGKKCVSVICSCCVFLQKCMKHILYGKNKFMKVTTYKNVDMKIVIFHSSWNLILVYFQMCRHEKQPSKF